MDSDFGHVQLGLGKSPSGLNKQGHRFCNGSGDLVRYREKPTLK